MWFIFPVFVFQYWLFLIYFSCCVFCSISIYKRREFKKHYYEIHRQLYGFVFAIVHKVDLDLFIGSSKKKFFSIGLLWMIFRIKSIRFLYINCLKSCFLWQKKLYLYIIIFFFLKIWEEETCNWCVIINRIIFSSWLAF